jgi:hypothetical protein
MFLIDPDAHQVVLPPTTIGVTVVGAATASTGG